MGGSDWKKGWGTWQEGPDHYITKLNIPNNVNLVVSNGFRPTQPKPTQLPIKTNHPQAQTTPEDTIVVESSASGIYFSATAPVDNLNKSAPQIRFGTASGELSYSSASAQLYMPQLPSYFTKYGHVMPSFNHSLIGLGIICDTEWSVNFHNHTVTIYDPQGSPLIQGWWDNTGAKLWRFAPRPQNSTPYATEEDRQAFTVVPYADGNYSDLQAFSAYDLPIVEALVRYFHAATGLLVKSKWLHDIKAGNFSSWPSLTYQNAANYCTSSNEKLKGHMAQTRHNVRSTNPKGPTSAKLQARPASPPAHPAEITNEVHIWENQTSKLYLDDTGSFTFRSRIGKRHVMIIFHCDSNTILQAPFKTKADKHRLETYNSIRGHLKSPGHTAELQIMDNESSTEYKRVITEDWGSRYQLVPLDMHRRNAAERAIHTFKAHFLATLAGTCAKPPNFLWDQLLE